MIVISEKLQETLNELKITNSETYYHCLHVKSLVFKMIKFMNREQITNYTPEEINYICKGAILHDIGKLHIKNAVLTKDSSLTSEEKISMENHTINGFEIIRDELNELEYDIIKNICLYHHERADGKGYEGKQMLPMYVQIVSICDVFDALRSDRVYRKKSSYADTMDIIKSGGSGYFNKKIIECLEKVTCDSEE